MRKKFRKLLSATLIVGTLTFAPEICGVENFPVACAEVKMYTAMGADYGNELESQDIVKLRARDKAIKNAVKQAGVYLKTYSRSVNSELTDDEVLAITSNSYELVGEVQYNRVTKQVTDQIILIVWEATVNVNVDDGEISKWFKRDDRDRSTLISQTRESQVAAEENDRKVEDLRKRAANVSDDAGRAQLQAEFKTADNEFLSNQKVEEGTRLAYQQKFDEAIQLYTEAIDLKPDNAEAYNMRGNIRNSVALTKILVDKNVPEGKRLRKQALDDLNRAIQLKPDYSEAYGNRGFVYYMAKDYSAAIKDFDRAIQFDPHNAQNYIYRSLYWRFVAKDNGRALADLNKAVELEPTAHAYMNRAGFYRLDLKNFSAAIDDYTRAIELETFEYMIGYYYYSRAECYQNLQRYNEAIDDYTRAIELMTRDDNFKKLIPFAYMKRGKCYEALGDNAKAQADMKKYNELK
ncbi:MAG: tetratricopeptide repeat protein [Selenomonadaceae bacterium]|nr:tetratricopeptide repeat protein [Selenomonadaceae bacterium]